MSPRTLSHKRAKHSYGILHACTQRSARQRPEESEVTGGETVSTWVRCLKNREAERQSRASLCLEACLLSVWFCHMVCASVHARNRSSQLQRRKEGRVSANTKLCQGADNNANKRCEIKGAASANFTNKKSF